MKDWFRILLKTGVVFIFSTLLLSVTFGMPNPEGIQVYQKNMHLSFEHKQKLAADIYRFHNADNIWDELRREFVLPHFERYPQVQEQIAWFMNHQDFLLNSANRAAPYLYFILQQVRKRHLPAELVLLPMIESGYNPFAYSTAGAAGLWQMMPGTASGFGVKQDWWYDGRRDVVASTRAALDYVSYLWSFFDGNWTLAIAAYDTGEGNVLSAIRKNVRDGRSTDFWSLPVAQETQIYLPRLLALATIISHPEMYPVPFPYVRNAPYLAQIDIGRQIDLTQAATLAGLNLKTLKQLNPGYNRMATDPNGPYKLVLPIEHVQQFTENLAHSPLNQPVNWTRYKVRSGDTWVAVAKKFNTSVDQLRKANPKLASNLKAGKLVMIPRSSIVFAKSSVTSKSSLFLTPETKTNSAPKKNIFKEVARIFDRFKGKYKLQPGDTLYMVRSGDNIEKIAKRFHMEGQVILSINKIKNKMITEGQQLIIPTHLNDSHSQNYSLTQGDTIYRVEQGDTLEKIALQFNTSPSEIRIANLLMDNTIQAGDRLVIPKKVQI